MPISVKYHPSKTSEDPKTAAIKKKIHTLIQELYDVKFRPRTITPGVDMIETAGKNISVEELINGTDAVLDGWWTEGPYAEEFKRLFQNFIGVRLCVLTNSGSSANLAAFMALTSPLLKERQVKKGDEVITIAASFPTTVNPIVQAGCIPVFIDVDLHTMNIDPKLLAKALSKKTKAIMIAHTQGNPFALDKIMKFAKKHNLWVIEDCCDALGAEYDGKQVGTFGDIATFSFYPAHQITLGEGGAVVTNNPWLYRAARSFRDWGRDCWCETGEDNKCARRFAWKFKNLPDGYDHKFVYMHIGYNLKLTDMQAAIGVAQIKRFPQFLKKRRENFVYLQEKLTPFKKYFFFHQKEKKSNPSWFGFMITLTPKCKFKLKDIVKYLNEKKIATRPLYCGNITFQPSFEKVKYRIASDLTNTNYIMNNTFWIGVHPNLTRAHMDYIAGTIGEFIKHNS